MTPIISTVLIESDGGTRNGLVSVCRSLGSRLEVLAAVADFQEGIGLIHNRDPRIVILEVREVERGVREIALILSRCPHAAVFVTTIEKNPDWILKLIRAGASEYLTKPIVAAELLEAIEKVARHTSQASGKTVKEGHAVAVYNPSGGMGTTTIAVNLAATIAAQGKKVALMDLNFLSGDVTAFLDLNPRYTLANVIANAERLDANFLMSVMAGHKSGIEVLSGPVGIEDSSRIMPEQMQEVLGVMKSLYDHVIIDAGGPLDGRNLAAFAKCDHVLYATVLNLPAIKNARRYLPFMNYSGSADRMKLVINRHTNKDDLRVTDAEKVLNTKAFIMIPNGYAEVIGSINKGVPLITSYPKSQVTKAIVELARLLTLEKSSQIITPQRTNSYDAIPAVQFRSAAVR